MKQYALKIYFGDNSAPAYFGGDRQDVDWPHESPDSWYHLS